MMDRFHVQKLAYEAVQEMRVKARWEALNEKSIPWHMQGMRKALSCSSLRKWGSKKAAAGKKHLSSLLERIPMN